MTNHITPLIRTRVADELGRIAASETVRIIFAVESGSRAWGFPSTDSDYDVRFIYAHEPAWYVTVFEGRDVIEEPITDDLDISGWDLRKALGLLRKSNPALMEWVDSSLVYCEDLASSVDFRELARGAFLPLAACHHYRSMTRHQQRANASSQTVRLKHYLYTLRPCLAAQWVIAHESQPPMAFTHLVEEFVPAGDVREQIDYLLMLKTGSSEADAVPRSRILDDYIETTITAVESRMPAATPALSPAQCNEAFRTLLDRCWNTDRAR